MAEVDDFIAANFQPEHLETVAMLRGLVRECAPDSREEVSYKMPVFKRKAIFAWLLPSKRGVTLGFVHGTAFDDPHGLLRGTGKEGRHIKVKDPAAVDPDVLRHYLRQALEHDR
ncbi:MAG: hypothetical protein QOE92_89 [Chloroflexota bacterium]|jgi:hypothetical protein|nr:hypothetical protein [Chloroflexota bacterium]